ncbi:MAG: universal stress protein [Muribaculaceae bacterium]|nr:universal stress protein [Muribaculaceae bacterium]
MTPDRLITVAIHTYEKATALKNLLENEGVPVVLQNVNLTQPVVSSGVRVRIRETDLPLALRIIENSEVFIHTGNGESSTELTVLVPVDFSDYSTRAATIAFDIANRHNARIVLMHAVMTPYQIENDQLTDALTFGQAEAEDNRIIENEADKKMKEFAGSLRQMIKDGRLPAVKFSDEILYGLPEETIAQYAKEKSPWLIVMGTRGTGKKERELIGSVTAEVLDSCRVQALTIPENCDLRSLSDLTHVVVFGNLEQEDILALDSLLRLLPAGHTPIDVTVACIPGKKHTDESASRASDSLLKYCTEHYPGYNFRVVTLTLDDIFNDCARIAARKHIDLIAVANKKRNIFARLFNPGLPHRLLFHFDIPMAVIPV